MSKELISVGNPFQLEHIDRSYGGARRMAFEVDGDGAITMGDLTVDNAGLVSIAGTAVLSGTVADDLSIAAGKDIVYAAGAGLFDASLGTGIFKSTTGENTLSGNVTIAGAKTLTTGTGLTTISGDLLMAAAKIVGFGAPQALSGAGAANVTTLVTLVTSTGGAQAVSLADGTQAGQLKIVHHTVDGGSFVLTPTTAGNFATFTGTNVHDACLLQWSGSAWNILLNVGGTVA